jgi:biopolymer transport protein ExbB
MGLIHKFNEGGIFMYAILVFGILSFALIIERYLSLYKKNAQPSTTFRKKILAFLTQGDLAGAQRFADTEENTSLAKIAKLGIQLRSQGAGDEEIQARMDEALSKEVHKIDQRTGFLAMFGNVATLLGLLGTISGMIQSFAGVAQANPADRATLLSRGISEAMNCTAFGLIVAIPALVAFAVYQNRTDRFVNKLTSLTSEIFHDLLFLIDTDRTTTTQFATAKSNANAPAMNHSN